jgi:carboxylesterase type B
VRPDSWGNAVRDAVEHGPVCPQMVWGFDARLSRQDEDCLSLDIYSPYQVNRYTISRFYSGIFV